MRLEGDVFQCVVESEPPPRFLPATGRSVLLPGEILSPSVPTQRSVSPVWAGQGNSYAGFMRDADIPRIAERSSNGDARR